MYKSYKRKIVNDFSRIPGQSNPFANKTGEINASSQKDLINQIIAIANAFANQSFERVNNSIDRETREEHRQMLAEALADQTGQKMLILGQALVEQIEETTSREGFLRRVMNFVELGQGEIAEIPIRMWDVTGFTAVSSTHVTPSIIRGRRYQPPEFNVTAFITIDNIELARHRTDLLEEKYEEGLESLMTQEDRLWKVMADQSVGVYNDLQSFSSLTRAVFAKLIDNVSKHGIPPTTTLFAADLWQDIIGTDDFITASFSPVTQWELLQEGQIGTMYGTTILTDYFRQANQRVLDQGEMYVLGPPINHGTETVRADVIAKPIDKHSDGKAQEGWFFNQITSVSLVNAKSVAKGKKI